MSKSGWGFIVAIATPKDRLYKFQLGRKPKAAFSEKDNSEQKPSSISWQGALWWVIMVLAVKYL